MVGGLGAGSSVEALQHLVHLAAMPNQSGRGVVDRTGALDVRFGQGICGDRIPLLGARIESEDLQDLAARAPNGPKPEGDHLLQALVVHEQIVSMIRAGLAVVVGRGLSRLRWAGIGETLPRWGGRRHGSERVHLVARIVRVPAAPDYELLTVGVVGRAAPGVHDVRGIAGGSRIRHHRAQMRIGDLVPRSRREVLNGTGLDAEACEQGADSQRGPQPRPAPAADPIHSHSLVLHVPTPVQLIAFQSLLPSGASRHNEIADGEGHACVPSSLATPLPWDREVR